MAKIYFIAADYWIALEIAIEKTIKVQRENAEELLKIRRGEIDLAQNMTKAE